MMAITLEPVLSPVESIVVSEPVVAVCINQILPVRWHFLDLRSIDMLM